MNVLFCCWISVVFFQIEVIQALAILKKAAATVNKEYGLDPTIADIIIKVAEEVRIIN